jgi:hypothetical protein
MTQEEVLIDQFNNMLGSMSDYLTGENQSIEDINENI